jgi:hypothetical protein
MYPKCGRPDEIEKLLHACSHEERPPLPQYLKSTLICRNLELLLFHSDHLLESHYHDGLRESSNGR